jgi:hypothetical protein
LTLQRKSTNKSTAGDVLYQGIEADGSTDNIPSGAKSKSSETLRLERRVGRHDVGGRASGKRRYLCVPEGGRWIDVGSMDVLTGAASA